MRTVQNILNAKARQFNQVPPGTRVVDALNLLNTLNLSYLVVTADDAYVGLFSERDYSRKVILQGRESGATTVAEVMSVDVPLVDPHDSVERCMHLMEQSKSRYLLVFDGDSTLLGVITLHDILRQVLRDKTDVFDRVPLARPVVREESGQVY